MRISRAIGAAALLVATGLAAAPAQAAPPAEPAPGMFAALQRDLGLDPGQAQERLDRELAAVDVAAALEKALGDRFGGAWLDQGQLVVASTDPADAGRIAAAGAQARTVKRSLAELTAEEAALDRKAVATSHVDVRTNAVLTRAGTEPGGTPAKAAPGQAAPRILAGGVRGGDYVGGAHVCAVGFAVAGGVVTAGTCGTAGQSAYQQQPDGSYQTMGVFAGSVTSGASMSWVRTDPGWTPQPYVRNGSGGVVRVAGSRAALVGSTVCRSGHANGWHCGEIEAVNASADFGYGTLRGLTRTDVCAESQDYGGPYLTGKQAQGTLVGWRTFPSSNCPSGGIFEDESYFQPVGDALTRFGLTLLVSPGTITNLSCDPIITTFRCTVAYNPAPDAQIGWVDGGVARPGWAGRTTVTGTCARGQWRTVSVTVATWEGPDTYSRSFRCEGRE